MGFDRLHPSIQYHVVNSLDWRDLRPLQEDAVDPILEGASCRSRYSSGPLANVAGAVAGVQRSLYLPDSRSFELPGRAPVILLLVGRSPVQFSGMATSGKRRAPRFFGSRPIFCSQLPRAWKQS